MTLETSVGLSHQVTYITEQEQVNGKHFVLTKVEVIRPRAFEGRVRDRGPISRDQSPADATISLVIGSL